MVLPSAPRAWTRCATRSANGPVRQYIAGDRTRLSRTNWPPRRHLLMGQGPGPPVVLAGRGTAAFRGGLGTTDTRPGDGPVPLMAAASQPVLVACPVSAALLALGLADVLAPGQWHVLTNTGDDFTGISAWISARHRYAANTPAGRANQTWAGASRGRNLADYDRPGSNSAKARPGSGSATGTWPPPVAHAAAVWHAAAALAFEVRPGGADWASPAIHP